MLSHWITLCMCPLCISNEDDLADTHTLEQLVEKHADEIAEKRKAMMKTIDAFLGDAVRQCYILSVVCASSRLIWHVCI